MMKTNMKTISSLKTKRNISLIVFIGLIKKLILLMILFLTTMAFAQKENKFIRQGNDKYDEENYKDAEVDYMKALEKSPESVKGQYNLGGALYKQENYEDASKLYGSIAGRDISDEAKADALYNLGNSYVKAQKFPEAISAYKNSLRLDPGDQDAKYNLEYAKRMLQQQQQQQQNQDQKKDQENKDDQKNKQDQDKKQDDQKQEDKQQQQDDQQKKQQQDQQSQPKPQQISKQDAERMLKALKNDENKTLEKVKLQQMKAVKAQKTDKDW